MVDDPDDAERGELPDGDGRGLAAYPPCDTGTRVMDGDRKIGLAIGGLIIGLVGATTTGGFWAGVVQADVNEAKRQLQERTNRFETAETRIGVLEVSQGIDNVRTLSILEALARIESDVQGLRMRFDDFLGDRRRPVQHPSSR